MNTSLKKLYALRISRSLKFNQVKALIFLVDKWPNEDAIFVGDHLDPFHLFENKFKVVKNF